jgi:hypothetical protein
VAGEEDEEQTWRSIVENYGERPEIEEPASEPPVDPAAPTEAPRVGSVFDGPVFNPLYDEVDRGIAADQGFVAPDPGWQPLPQGPRLAAWTGLLLGPAFLLLAAILHLRIPGWLVAVLVVGFVGGFGYLVWQMPREPREPWDDGSRI